MIYNHRPKIRAIMVTNLINLTHRFTVGVRFNTNITNSDIIADNEMKASSEIPDKAMKTIKILNCTERNLQSINTLNSVSFKSFQKLTERKLKNIKLLKRKTEYKSCEELNKLADENQIRSIILKVQRNESKGDYLTHNEFKHLFVQFLPFKWYAYKLLKIQQKEINYDNVNDKMLDVMLQVSFAAFDYKLFDQLFQILQHRKITASANVLSNAIQVYLKTENIHMAIQIFHQSVMTEKELPNYLLNIFISNLYNKTKNPNLCLSSYKLWISRNHQTNPSIDSFMYNLLVECNLTEDIAWIEQSLEKRGLTEKFVVKFGRVCNQVSKTRKSYDEFMKSELLTQYVQHAKEENEVSSLLNNLTYLHLKHGEFGLALETFMKINNKKNFEITIFSLLRHFEKFENPEMVFQLLKKLKEESNFKIHWTHVLIYWRGMINKYPHLGYGIHRKLRKALSKSKYHQFGFLSNLLVVKKIPVNVDTDERRHYASVKYDNINSELKPLPTDPYLRNIESRLYSGILPDSEILRKAIRLTNDPTEIDRLFEIVKNMNRLSRHRVKSVRLNLEMYYKRRNRKKALELFSEQIDFIENSKMVDCRDLIELFKFCVKSKLYDKAIMVLDLFEKYNVKIVGDQNIMRFLSMFIKYCWSTKQFKELITILEWLKGEKNIIIDEFFWFNLKTAGIKNREILTQMGTKSLENKNKDNIEKNVEDKTVDEIVENSSEEDLFLQQLIPKMMSYYDLSVYELKNKNEEKCEEVIDTAGDNFKYLVKWIDEDTEILFGTRS